MNALEGFQFDDNYIHRLRSGDEAAEGHFVSYFGTLLQIKLKRRLICPDHLEDIQGETLARVLDAIRSDSCIPHPERLGAFVNAVCNKLLHDFRRAPMLHKPLGDLPLDHQDKAMNADIDDVLGKELVQQVLHRLPSRDQQILRTAVVIESSSRKDEIYKNLEVSRDYLRVLLFRAKQQFGATLRSAQKSNRC